MDGESSPPLDNFATVITAIISGIGGFIACCICFCVIMVEEEDTQTGEENFSLFHKRSN